MPSSVPMIPAGAIPPELVSRFAALFAGYSKAFGIFTPGRPTSGGKVSGRATTEKGEAGHDHYAAHLLGSLGLGIVMVRDDDTCLFGAIDYDVRDMDHPQFVQKIYELQLPLVLCRSKSGGGHFYCFVQEPVDASVMRARLAEFAAALGISRVGDKPVEIFPKQTTRIDERDVGSWINLPYWSALTEPGTDRYAFDRAGDPIRSVSQALDLMEEMRVTDIDRFTKRWLTIVEGSFPDGPPCLQMLETMGPFPEGTRNNGLFAIGVYLRKRFPDGDEWKSRLHGINQILTRLGHNEVEQVIKSLQKKGYGYRCREAPLAMVCDRESCVSRKFGIRESEGGSQESIDETLFGAVTKYVAGHPFEDPQWALEIDGRRIWLTHEEFQNKAAVNSKCLAAMNKIPIRVRQDKWLTHVEELARVSEEVVLPEPVTRMGQLWEGVRIFCEQSPVLTLDEAITAKRPYYRDDGKVVVNLGFLIAALQEHNNGNRPPELFWQYCRWRGAVTIMATATGTTVPTPMMIFPEFPRINEIVMSPEERAF